MDEIKQYDIVYTETAIQNIEEKADHIALKFHDITLAETWYQRLISEIRRELSSFPFKFPLYQRPPWNEKGVRLMLFRNDVILYSVGEDAATVYIRGVCTKGRDLSAHLMEQEET